MIAEIEQHITEIQDRLRSLPASSVALFSAACAERLADVYKQFTAENGWDCYPKIRRILDLCWEVLAGHNQSIVELRASAPELLHYVPHADNFTSLLSIGAQDFAACLESAIKWILNAANGKYGAPYYSLEYLYDSALDGLLDAPSVDDPNNHTEVHVARHPAIAKEFTTQESILSILETKMEIAREDVESIRQSAVENRHRLSKRS